jgi:hypothetical protein
MDDADLAEERNAHEMERRLAASKGFVELQVTGYCHYCESQVAQGHKFCDSLCAKDWSWEQQRRRQNQ